MVYCTRLYFSYVTLQGRAPILGGFDMESTVFAGKTLLITGGTGSFGNTVLKHFLSTDIGEIRIFSRDEKKQDDMRHDYQDRKSTRLNSSHKVQSRMPSSA